MTSPLLKPADGAAPGARHLAGDALALALRDSRAQTWACVQDLSGAQWLPPCREGINPIAWELGHLTWFAEYWVLRAPHARDAAGFATSQTAPRFGSPDAHFDSARSAHVKRWEIALPSRASLQSLMQAQLEACIETIPDSGTGFYHHRLALFHEDMHAEALRWMRSSLGYSAPAGLLQPRNHPQGQVELAGGPLATGRLLSAEEDAASKVDQTSLPDFVFDNEIGTQTYNLAPFTIDSAPLSAGEFSRFVEAGGYDNPAFWPGDAGVWRANFGFSHPETWRKASDGTWQQRWFDHYLPLEPMGPVIHVNAFEAEAYCQWAKRRLPRAAEWEYAALQSKHFHWGHSVWEWTADNFAPYPGFTPGPYREYSAPWFGNHRELRGGSFATHARMHHVHYRNFFMPQRSDIFAGFRTVAL